ncbi:MAG: 50S ribosome-binding GTPase, partial [Pirellulales bacterium]|nr:50S ribosome-binding GTPase [Pirellulales bacterium]
MSSSTQQVVIVGRPNVGKSSIFNWLSQRRIAIEDPTAGVTRDRLTQRIECGEKIIDLIDTGGMG